MSVLDYVPVTEHGTVNEAIRGAVMSARAAEEAGYSRIWYTEHHGQARVAASSPSVLIAEVASRTNRIRVGAGGVMLPNHPPFIVAEQFGTLEAFHPGRIDLGVGRAPGGDARTLRFLRRNSTAPDRFREDVSELRDLLAGDPMVGDFRATPGFGARTPIHILGSSVRGAQLAADFGMPLVFAAHFSPDSLEQATNLYHSRFQSSAQQAVPRVIVTANVLAAADAEAAATQYRQMLRTEARKLLDRPNMHWGDDDVDVYLDSADGKKAAAIFRFAAVGTGPEVIGQLEEIARASRADELMLVHQGPTLEDRINSLRLAIRPGSV
ncbi:MsnO8 family LLM class oxidoreductase [Microbacterium phyllosphaerae]|uniref:MsnO8 family LLM class oxidoreductase n=1 Tax=Microbacterium phyllosphaerae TaxID=124798 RepID=UPI003D65E198